MIALLDTDLYAYRVSVGLDNESSPELAIHRVDSLIADTLRNVKADEYLGFFSPPRTENYRRLLWPLYKANRTQPTPRWLPEVKEYLVKEKGIKQLELEEADDALGCAQKEDTIICSIDKDLMTIPGMHYNFVKNEFNEVSKYAAEFNFWKQMITGDRSDNVIGIPKLGEVKATRILQQLEKEEWKEYIENLYDNPARFALNYNLLRIWKEPYMLYFDNKDNKMNTREEFIAELKKLRDELAGLLKEKEDQNND